MTTVTDATSCLGTMTFGTRVPTERALALLDAYVAAGGRWLDTANNYAFWAQGGTGDESELVLGRWLAQRDSRAQVQLATKVGARPSPGSRSLDDVLGLGAATVPVQLAGSLARLGTDRVDLLYAHVDDTAVSQRETLGAFDALVRDGRVGEVGGSNLTAARLSSALALSSQQDWAGYRAVQVRATFLTSRAGADFAPQVEWEPEVAAVAAEHGLRVFGYAALLAGGYAGRPVPVAYQHNRTTAQLAAVHAVARRSGVTANQVVLAWLRAHAVLPVLGVSTLNQLAQALEPVELDPGTVAELDAARSAGPVGGAP